MSEFKGVDWSSSLLRPGCQDALKCPSIRNGKPVPYRVPYLNASSVNRVPSHINKGVDREAQ